MAEEAAKGEAEFWRRFGPCSLLDADLSASDATSAETSIQLEDFWEASDTLYRLDIHGTLSTSRRRIATQG